jgi:hypothetical protein
VWRKLVIGVVVIPLAAVLIAVAIVNRKPALLVLDPLGGSANPRFSVEAPFFLFLLGAFALGLVIGGCATWLGQGKWRRTARTQGHEARELRHKADRLERELEGSRSSPHRLRLPAD